MAKHATPPAKQLVATLPFRSEQIGDPDANYDVSVWRGTGMVCEKQSHSPCDTSGLFYGSAEDEVTKFCARHFYEMHSVPGPTYRLVDPPVEPTPGPWHIEDAPNGKPFITNQDREHVCTLYDGRGSGRKEANALLIALSPEMRDALLAVFSLFRPEIESEEELDISGADFLDAFLEWRGDYRDVLDKLEGRAA